MTGFLRNLSIGRKLAIAISAMVTTLGIVSYCAFDGFNKIGIASAEVNATSERIEHSGRATANLLSYTRAVEFLPIEMPRHEREAFERSMADEATRFRRRIDQVEAGVRTQSGRDDIAKIRDLMGKHEAEARRIMQMSREGAYDDAGKMAVKAAPIIADIRQSIRQIEDRAMARRTEAIAAFNAAHAQATWAMTQVLIVGTPLSLLVVAVVVFGFVSRPLNALTTAMLEVASGQTDGTIPAFGQTDEIGKLAGALETFKANLLESRRLAMEQETERAGKERRANVVAAAVAEFEASVSEVVSTVTSASSELEAAAATLTGTADATQQKSSMVAAAAEQASGNVQAVAAASDEMTSSIHEIARQVQHSTEKAKAAVADVKATDAKVAQLLEAAGRIGDVVKLITAVAEQTNLLALNATIEAARAGEAGKGFAVVASEVKALAGQTAKATEAIGAQITAMQAATREAAACIQSIGTTIVDVSEIAAAIAASVEEQGAATQEISRNVQEAARGTAEVAAAITDVNQGAVETGSASSQVLAASQELSQQGSRLKAQVDTFLATVRAA